VGAKVGERALEALASGGTKAFDAVVRGTAGIRERAERDPVFAGVLNDFRDPAHPFGSIAVSSPNTELPADLTSKYAEMSGMTFGDVLAEVATKTSKSMDGGDEGSSERPKTKATKQRRFADGFDLPVKEEREVTLRAARIALVISKVVDGDGKLVENAVVTVMVCDRTL
jgi:hypothetical protein